MNLHEELGRHGAEATADAARRLESAPVRERLSARVRRGRRNKNWGAAGVAAAIAIIAVGVWTLGPLNGRVVEPAVPDPAHAGPYRYDVTPGADVRSGEPEVRLRGDDAAACGDVLDLTPGVTIHDEAALGLKLWATAELTTLGERMGSTPPATPVPLDPDKPDGLMTGWDPDSPTWSVELGGILGSYEVVALLMDGDTVMGATMGLSGGSSTSGEVEAVGGAPIPRVGYCEPSAQSLTADIGSPMDTVLVFQFWETGVYTEEGTPPLATIVVNPRVPLGH